MLKNALVDFWKDESGLSAVEYAIAGSLVVGGMVIAFGELGTEATQEIVDLCSAVNSDGDCTGTAPAP
ncbi:pilus assembly protein Flp/PilA [Ferrimonas sediminum]|uniref:Pilus assembly protein Flp/PilA n=1 Tax=Ferrimonas sediminum TaxID=718193 RepID=A0A1G8YE98_9GAMM|nr:Flp family type IVb pilin [Ferrimonas sediminum]SDK01202.1 pilus assembly protein Flp/PilA [Ferrimonas sediminum]